MAVYSFEWRSGYGPTPVHLTVPDDVVYYEADAETYEKGFPLSVDNSESTTGNVVFKRGDSYADIVLFLASRDASTATANVDMSDYTADSDLPILVRPGDVFSVGSSADGAEAVTSGADLGMLYDWIASTTTTTRAVLDTADTYKHWAVIGFDDRDAIGTSGGRLLVTYVGGGSVATDAQVA